MAGEIPSGQSEETSVPQPQLGKKRPLIESVTSPVGVMLAAGLEDDEIMRLAHFKHQIDVGAADDLTIEHKRITFLKHLVDNGLIQS